MRALIETRRDPRCGPTLDALAGALASLGYETIRWRNDTRPLEADLFVLWNGQHPAYRQMRAAIGRRPALFAELGWLPQDGCFQLDPRGINAEASWAQEPPVYVPASHLGRRRGDLLVVLQDEDDMQIRLPSLSPYQEMLPWLQKLRVKSAVPLRVRFHPRARVNPNIVGWLSRHPAVRVDGHESFEAALDGAMAVATINSTCGLEAIQAGVPVLCYGQAVYRVPYVSYTVNGRLTTSAITGELKRGECSLCPEAMQQFIERIKSHQWVLADLPGRLERLLATMGE